MDSTRTDARAFEVHIPLTVKTYDVDFSGVVSHLTFLRWLEDLRLQMLIEHPPLQWQVDAGGVPVVARTAVHYREPVGIGDALGGALWVSRVGRSRWTLSAEFSARGRLVAEATQSGCFLDQASRRPVALRPEIRDRVHPAPAVRDAGAPFAGVRPAGRRGWRELMGAGSGSLASRR
ncbi:MAG: acyl-CoA thioesterase [Gammaproteobacteria bacterium]|jgi:acyl-CoA thioester hydrolase|nr:acyl-CoA thioesterase [Gammaproteobacteria bacterium]